MSQTATHAVQRAVDAFRAGEPVLVYDFDDREAETDIVYPAADVSPAAVTQLRNDAGGLICVALSYEVAEAFDLPFVGDELDHPATENPDLAYDARSSFSLTVNHRDTFTGITDEDRSLTITALADAARNTGETSAADFAATFRAPGHVHLLKAARGLLDDRLGQTELGIALANAADREPAVVVCEMLDDETGTALPKDAAKNYAERHDIPFVDGDVLIEQLG